MKKSLLIASLSLLCGITTATPAWKKLPYQKPAGSQNHMIKCYVSDPDTTKWKRPPFVYDHDVATQPRHAKVVVINYNPVFEKHGGSNLVQILRANDPREFSDILVESIRECSGGYINYEIVDYIERDEFPQKIDGFRYTDDSFLEARKNSDYHQPDKSDYRLIFETNNLIERCRNEGITEVWIWGAGGFGYDELSMYIPNRYARFAPTDNPWFYRPYDIPEEIDHTIWVMGFNYEVGADNMLHSYGHRCESILALVFGNGKWGKELVGDDPFNTFTSLEMDHPGTPSHCGNVHVPPNGQKGYDYNNPRKTLSYADAWQNGYPDLSKAEPRLIGAEEWGNSQFGYQKWWMSHFPRNPGYTQWGYNNWWVYIANTDEDLPLWQPAQSALPFSTPHTATK